MIDLTLSTPLKNPFGEEFYSEINQHLFAKQSSETVYKAHYADIFNKEEMLYLVVGTDSGLFYKYVKSQKLPATLKFLFIELNELNDRLGVEFSDDPTGQQISVVSADFDFNTLHKVFESYVVRNKIQLIRSMAVMDAKPGSPYHHFWDDIEIQYLEFLKGNIVDQNSAQFENARLLNAADNVLPLKTYKNTLEGATALVLGGGPTLDDAIDWIKQNQSKLVIFSVARIARRLKKEGIVPDFFVSVDPHDVSFDNSKGIFAFQNQAILLNGYHVNPKLLGQWAGLTCYTGNKYGWKNDDYPRNLDSLGPTVTNTAVNVAAYLGCQNIVLSGLDFCFAKGRTHESSSDEAKVASQLSYKDHIKVETNSGDMTPTEPTFASARNILEQQIGFYLQENASLQFYSTGWGSAKIENVQYASPDSFDFLTTLTTKKLDELKDLLSISSQQRIDYVVKTIEELEKQKQRFNKLEKLGVEALEIMPKLYAENSSEPKQKVLNKVIKLRKKMNHLIGDDGDLLMSYRGANFSETFKPVEDEESLSSDEVSYQLTSFFKGVKSSTEQYQVLIVKAIDRAKLRLDELENKAAVSDLYERWLKLNELGRAHVWLEWHPDVSGLSSADLDLVKDAQQQFQQELEKTDTTHFHNLKRNTQDISKLLARAERAFGLVNQKELHELLKHAPQLNKANEATDFSALLNGMLAETNQNEQEAEAYYKTINVPILKHCALKRMLDLAMRSERHNESLVLLEKLCVFSLDYMVPYADLLALIGQLQMSAEVLRMYLEKQPVKVNVHIKLAQRLIDLGQLDGARQTLEQVLLMDKDNQTAQILLMNINQ